ncbi:Protein-tyrosine phosphatase, partial [Ostertagia ostertagi]
YTDVPCQDSRRVVLKWPGIDNDYIHANYVATPSKDNHFICTQDRNKCEQYWPHEVGEVMTFGEDNEGKITVTNLDVSPMSEEDYFVRVTKLKLDYKDKDTGKDASSIVHHLSMGKLAGSRCTSIKVHSEL